MEQIIKKTKIRESNFELLRVIAMLMVLVLHADFEALGVPTYADIISSPIASALKVFFEMGSIVAVNVFVLISGWFGIRPSVKGFSKFVFQWLFFAIGIYLVLALWGKIDFSLRGIANSIAFMHSGSYWFILSYICLYFFSPVLNAFIQNADKRTCIYFIVTFYIFQTLYSFLGGGANFLMKGYSALSFMGLYVLAAFVRKHIDFSKYNCWKLFVGYILLTIAMMVTWMFAQLLNVSPIASRVLCYSNPLVVLSSLMLLMTFSKIKCRSSIINYIAAGSFAVYLLHCHPNVYPLYLDSVREAANISTLFIPGVVLLWFIASLLLDFIRVTLWEGVTILSKKHFGCCQRSS